MQTNLRRKLNRRASKRGQGMTEYIIIVALIAIAAIGVVTVFGQDIRHLFGAATSALEGDTNAQARTQRGLGQRKAGVQKNLQNFGTQNAGN